MNTKEIQTLLNSFYNGETSQSEELQLLEYFNSTEVVEELFEEKELFLQFYDAESITAPPALEDKLHLLIDKLGKQEKRPTKHLVMWTSVAACAAILLLVGVYVNKPSFEGNYAATTSTQEKLDTNATQFSEAEYIQAENAMRMLCANFNKGMEQLDEMNNKLEQTNNILNKTFKKIDSHEN